MSTNTFPENIDTTEEEVKEFLDDLRDSGKTNMFGAAPYILEIFDMTTHEANQAVLWWMGQY